MADRHGAAGRLVRCVYVGSIFLQSSGSRLYYQRPELGAFIRIRRPLQKYHCLLHDEIVICHFVAGEGAIALCASRKSCSVDLTFAGVSAYMPALLIS